MERSFQGMNFRNLTPEEAHSIHSKGGKVSAERKRAVKAKREELELIQKVFFHLKADSEYERQIVKYKNKANYFRRKSERLKAELEDLRQQLQERN